MTIAILIITHMSCGEDGAGLTWLRAVMPFQQNMHCTKWACGLSQNNRPGS